MIVWCFLSLQLYIYLLTVYITPLLFTKVIKFNHQFCCSPKCDTISALASASQPYYCPLDDSTCQCLSTTRGTDIRAQLNIHQRKVIYPFFSVFFWKNLKLMSSFSFVTYTTSKLYITQQYPKITSQEIHVGKVKRVLQLGLDV